MSATVLLVIGIMPGCHIRAALLKPPTQENL
jgi:hypothetical protein